MRHTTLATLLLFFASLASALAADMPFLPVVETTPQQKQWLTERTELRKDIEKLQGKDWNRALQMAEKMVTVDRQVFGNVHRETADSLDYVYSVYYRDGDYRSAADSLAEIGTIIAKLLGDDHWRVREYAYLRYRVVLLSRHTEETRALLTPTESFVREARKLLNDRKSQQALETAAKASEGFRLLYTDESPDLAGSLRLEAEALMQLRRFDESEAKFQEAARLIAGFYGPQSRDYGFLQLDLGSFYSEIHDWLRAERALRLAQGVFEVEFKGKGIDLAQTNNLLAAAYTSLGQPARALEMNAKVLAHFAEGPDKLHPYHRTALSLRSMIKLTQGQFDEAEQLAREALELAGHVDKVESLGYAVAQKCLADVLAQSRTKPEECLRLVTMAKSNVNALLGDRDQMMADLLMIETRVHFAQDKFDAADETARAALSIRREHSGTDARVIRGAAIAVGDIGYAKNRKLQDAGQLDQSREVLIELEKMLSDNLGADDYETVSCRQLQETLEKYARLDAEGRRRFDTTRDALGEIVKLSNARKFAESLALCEQTLRTREELIGADDDLTARLTYEAALAHQALGQVAEADALIARATDLYRMHFAPGHLPPIFVYSLNEQALLMLDRKDVAAAAQLLGEVRRNFRATMGEGRIEYSDVTNQLARAWIALGEYEKADALLKEFLAVQERRSGAKGEAYADTLHSQFLLAAQTGGWDEATDISIKSYRAFQALDEFKETAVSLIVDMGLLQNEHGEHKEALAQFESAKKHLDKFESAVLQRLRVPCLRGLAIAHKGLGDLEKAKEAAQEALAVQQKKFPGLLSAWQLELEVLNEVELARAKAAYASGDLAAYVAAHEQAAAMWQQALNAEHWRTRDAQSRLAYAKKVAALKADDRKKLDAAIASFDEALKSATKAELIPAAVTAMSAQITQFSALMGDDNVVCLEMQKKLMHQQSRAGDSDAAVRTNDAILAAARKLLGEVSYLAGQSELAQAQILAMRHSNDEALTAYERGANTLRAAIGERHPDYGAALSMWGSLLLEMSDFPTAHERLRQAHAILSQHQTRDPVSYLDCLGAYGRVCSLLDDPDRAELLLRRMYSVGFRVAPRLAVDAELFLGAHLQNEKQYAKAEPLLREAAEGYRIVFGEKSASYASALAQLANSLRDRGDYLLPAPLYQQAIDIYTAVHGPTSRQVAAAIFARGQMQLARGDLAAAQKDIEEAMKLFGRESTFYNHCGAYLADIALQSGDEANAAKRYGDYLSSLESAARYGASVQTEAQQLVTSKSIHEYLGHLLSIRSAAAADVYNHVLSWKGSVFTRQQQMRSARGTPELAAAFAEWERLNGQLATLALRIPYAEDRDLWFAQVQQLCAERDAIEAKLAVQTTKSTQKQVTSDQLAKCLPDDAALVDFIEYIHRAPAKQKGQWDSQRRMAAFIVRKGQPVERVDLGAAESIAKAVDQWLKRNKPEDGEEPADLDEIMRLGKPLAEQIWMPLAKSLSGANTILVSPDGPIDRFPLGALPGSSGKGFVIEEQAIVMVPVPAMLPALLATEPVKAGGTLVAFGDVDYSNGGGGNDVRTRGLQPLDPIRSWLPGTFPPLAGTGPEADAVADRFTRTFDEGKVVMLTGRAGNEGAFRSQAGTAEWLHLATHGFYAPDLIESALASDDQQPTNSPGEAPRRGLRFHPGLLSGLALAGANMPNRINEDDGILSSIEVAALDLSRVQLAVLSACQTAQGQEAGGEGVLGLQRAFQVAGARSVVATLWPIDDQGTPVLMMKFYFNLWSKRMSRLEALRDAQRWMLTGARNALRDGENPTTISLEGDKLNPAYLHPSFWAPFVLSGDWR